MDNEINKYFVGEEWHKLMKDVKHIKSLTLNGNNFFHIACIRGRDDIVNTMLMKFPELVYVSNNDGDTCVHLLAKNGFYEIMKNIIKKFPDTVTFINNKGETVPQTVVADPVILAWLIDTMPTDYKDSYNNLTYEGWTLLLSMLKHTTLNDVYVDLMQKLISKGAKLNYPLSKPPLIYASMYSKPDVVNLLLKNGANPNIKDTDNITPIMRSIMNNNYDTTKLLIKYGSNVNYGGPENDNIPINLAILKKNSKIINLLIDNGSNMNTVDRFLNTPVHYLLQTNKTNNLIHDSTIFKALYSADLNIRNIKGVTPLHMMTRYNTWKNYSVLLKDKHIDLSIIDRKNNTAVSYLNGDNLTEFINTVAEGKITNIPKCSNYTKNKCMSYVKNNLLSRNTIDQSHINNLIKLPKNKLTNFGLFNSDIIHNCIYTIILLKKYKNLMIPFQYFNQDKQTNDMILLESMNGYRDEKGLMLMDILKLYTEYFYELVPHLIIWADKNIHNINKNLKIHTVSLLSSNKIRFILFKLTVIPNTTATHANIILYDKQTKELVRFEPYGPIDIMDNEILNKYLSTQFKLLLGVDIKILLPESIMSDSRFQSVSSDNVTENKKLGDPMGYCLAWVFWFIELKMANQDTDTSVLIKDSFNMILNKKDDGNNPFIDHIRNYAAELDKEKNKFLLKSEIKSDDIYNLSYDSGRLEKIVKHLLDDFNEIKRERINELL